MSHYNLMLIEYDGLETFGDPVTNKERTVPVYKALAVAAEGRWSGHAPVPHIGDHVTINFNQLGSGIVESYFIEGDWLGVAVKLDQPPDWWKKQNPGRHSALVFGIELDKP